MRAAALLFGSNSQVAIWLNGSVDLMQVLQIVCRVCIPALPTYPASTVANYDTVRYGNGARNLAEAAITSLPLTGTPPERSSPRG